MTHRQYRAGIIGLGFIGAADQVSGDVLGQQVTHLDGTHLSAYLSHPDVEIVAGSSRDPGRRTRFLERISAQHDTSARPPTVYESWRDMIEHEQLDIVSIATYTPVHAEITAACAEAGIKVIYCEKPMASTLEEADRMIERCASAGSLLVINHNRRFHPNFRRLADLISRDGLGTLTSVTARWATGRLGNVGTHVIDAVLMVTGLRPTAVWGILDDSGRPDCRGTEFHDPGGWGLVRLGDRCMLTIDAADYANCPMLIEIQGTDGSARIEGKTVHLSYRSGEHESWPDETGDLSSMDVATGEMIEWLDAKERSGDTPSFSYPPAGARDTLETIIAFHVSNDRDGARVDLPLSGTDRTRTLEAG